MSKELDYIADLERENRTLKSLLYCTKRSCNNCGKVNCENFQRQRIDCCGLWVSYKDYIAELENKIADIKANCDLAIEGRDIKIMELEQQVEKMRCCGNCSHRHYWGDELGCNLDFDKQLECDNNNKKYWEFKEG